MTKTVGVFRAGAYGDLMFASSVFAGLKQQGYHVTLYSTAPANIIVKHDPNIDVHIMHDSTIPMDQLHKHWDTESKKYDKWINLSASIECEWLQLPTQPTYYYPLSVREKLYDHNYLEHQHLLADVPNVPQIQFFPTGTEIMEADYRNNAFFNQPKILVWVLGGSSMHKVNPHINTFVANILKTPGIEVVLVGSREQDVFAAGLKGIANVTSITHWDIRMQYTFVKQYADVIVGPETGIMVAMSQEPLKKVVLLSHSTPNMLTRDWINTTAVFAESKDLICGGCCKFRLSEGDDIQKFENTGYACCQVQAPMQDAFFAAMGSLT